MKQRTEQLKVCYVRTVPNLANDIRVETFFHLVKTILVKMLPIVAFKRVKSNTRDHSPKKLRARIGLKLCFYNSMEAQN